MPYGDRIALLLPLLGCASAFSSTARLLPTRRSAVMTAERTAADFCRTSPHAARRTPEHINRLCGYDVFGPQLGYFGDMQHPTELLGANS